MDKKLTDLRIGNIAIINARGYQRYTDVVVTKITPTQITVAYAHNKAVQKKFHIKNGYLVGGDKYRDNYLTPLTDTILQYRARQALLEEFEPARKYLIEKLNNTQWLTIDDIHKLQVMYDNLRGASTCSNNLIWTDADTTIKDTK